MNETSRTALPPEFDAGRLAVAAPPMCPVDRLPSRRRNKVCLWIISVGVVNFVLYTAIYAALGGDAPNGHRELTHASDGSASATYFVRGHFIRTLDGRERQVSFGWWMYSYLHSITLPITSGAMILSMLVLARPHILATMRGSRFGGRAFVVTLATLAIGVSLAVTGAFIWNLATELAAS